MTTDALRAFGWNVEQILVYIWQCVAGDATEQEYPFKKFLASEMGRRLMVELATLAAPASETELPRRPNIAELEQIISDNPRAKDVWVKPDGTVTVRLSETEKLPAKWHKQARKAEQTLRDFEGEACIPDPTVVYAYDACADELEAALKDDRVGAPTSKP